MSCRLLPVVAAACVIAASSAVTASACEFDKARSARAASASVEKACGSAAKTAAVAKTAKAACTKEGKSAVTASAASSCRVGAALSADNEGCRYKASTAFASAHGAKGADATVAGSSSACGSHKSAKTAVATKAAADAVVAGGSSCRTGTSASKYAHADCAACADWAECEGQLESVQSRTQVVPLKNGVMFVFTAGNENDVRIVQQIMSGRHDRLQAIVASGDEAKLCGQCKVFRGAMASGNLNREIVNIEGGVLMIMTSPNREMVNQLRVLAGLPTTERVAG